MVIFNSTAAVVQLIKIAIYFITLGLPAVEAPGAQLKAPLPQIEIHDVERPHSNPRRNR